MKLHPDLVAHRDPEVADPLCKGHLGREVRAVSGHDGSRQEVGRVGDLVAVEAETPERGNCNENKNMI